MNCLLCFVQFQILNLQNVRLRDIVTLKGCFNKMKNQCRKPKRRPRKKQKRHPRREPKCGYRIVGSGSSNVEEDTYFTPVIYKQRRGIRPRGQQSTIWLSDTPNTPYTKVASAADFSIASLARLKVAVHKNRGKRQVYDDPSSLGKFLLALKKIGDTETKEEKNRKPSTKWITLYIINAQLDTSNTKTAQEQLGILLEYLKTQQINQDGNSIIMTVNTNEMFKQDIAKMLQDEGFLSAKETARVGSSKPAAEGFGTMLWIKDLESVVYAYTRKNNADSLVSSLLYQ